MLNSNSSCSKAFLLASASIFKEIVVDGPLGKTMYYVIYVEIQVHGPPHVHYFLLVTNTSVLIRDNTKEYVAFVDQIIHT